MNLPRNINYTNIHTFQLNTVAMTYDGTVNLFLFIFSS